ncbi:hypothetical protein OHC33_006946 [Knufia fluminis]|uniref:Uncharacterized protein n=1 Tax=Knufia fluminis TaxID=191047 RepID=A0AAN8EC73_9EURO|nr:hypothetical protein OHC33_006946 [Knufia fluminis]
MPSFTTMNCGSGTNPPPNTPEKPKGGKRHGRMGCAGGTKPPPNTPTKPGR